MKPLELFYEMKHYLSLEWGDLEDLDIVEQSLKALEIIKEKRVNVGVLFYITNVREGGLNSYNIIVLDSYESLSFLLTQEEYDLLKKVLL